jgi:hypothetical protein
MPDILADTLTHLQVALSAWESAHKERLAEIGSAMELYRTPVDIETLLSVSLRWGATAVSITGRYIDEAVQKLCTTVIAKCPTVETLAGRVRNPGVTCV